MPDRSNRIARTDALSVLCREVIESHELLTVFVQTDRRLQIPGPIDLQEQVKSLFGIPFGLSLPDGMQSLFDLPPH